MKLNEFINLHSIFVEVEADSKKTVFKKIANLFSKKSKIKPSLIIEKLNERERLGSTGVGEGVAIPHSKIEGVSKTMVIFIKLVSPVDFSSSDNKDVDMLFSIIAPAENTESEHLLILSSISNFLKKKESLKKLRSLKTPEKILSFLSKF